MMPDRDIVLSIDLDVQDALKTADQLHKEVEGIFESRKGKQSSTITALQIQMKQTRQQAQELQRQLEEVRGVKAWGNDAATLEEVLVNLKKVTLQYQLLKEAEEQALQTGSAVVGDQTLNLQQIEEWLDETATTYEVLSKRAKLEQALDATNDKLKLQAIRYEELSRKQFNVQKYIDLLVQGLRRFRSILSKLMAPLRRVFNSMVSGFRRSEGSMRRALRNLMVFGLGVTGLVSILRKLRSAVLEGFENLKESNLSKIKDQINELKASVLTLKNTLASMAEPIVTTILPYLQEMTDRLVVFFDKVAQFVAAARGQKTYIKAVKQTGDAIEKMGKQANKAVSPLDDLNVIQSESPMFELAEISDEVLAEVQAFKEVFDLDNVGVTIGEFVNKIFTNLHEKLQELPSKIEEYFNGWTLTDTFVQIMKSVNWGEVGSTIGDGVNVALDFLNGWLKDFEEQDGFKTLGTSVGDFFNNLFETANWENIGNLLGGLVKGAIDAAWSFATTVDIEDWSTDLADAINSFFTTLLDEDGAGKNAWQKIGETAAQLTAFVVKLIDKIEWDKVVTGFVEGLEKFWNTTPPEVKLKLGKVLAIGLTLSIGTTLLQSALKTAFTAAVTKLFTGGATTATAVVGTTGVTLSLPVILALAAGAVTLALLPSAWESLEQDAKNVAENPQFKAVIEALKTGGDIGEAFNEAKKRREEAVKIVNQLWQEKGLMYGNGTRTEAGWKYDPFLIQWEKEVNEYAEKLKNVTNGALISSGSKQVENFSSYYERAGEDGAKNYSNAFLNGFNKTAIERDTSIKQDFIDTFGELPNEAEKVGEDIGKKLQSGFASQSKVLCNQIDSTFSTILAKARTFNTNLTAITSGYAAGQIIPPSISSRIATSGNATSTGTNSGTSIQEALYGALEQMGFNSNQEIVLNLDGREFMRAMVKNNNEYKKQHGGQSAFA